MPVIICSIYSSYGTFVSSPVLLMVEDLALPKLRFLMRGEVELVHNINFSDRIFWFA